MKQYKQSYIIGGIFAVLTFLLFYYGVAFVLKQDIILKNIIGFLVFSLVVGLISGIFASLGRKYGLIIFILGYALGFGSMFVSFYSELSGWEDLIGFLQMLMILGIATALGALMEIAFHFIDKSKENKKEIENNL